MGIKVKIKHVFLIFTFFVFFSILVFLYLVYLLSFYVFFIQYYFEGVPVRVVFDKKYHEYKGFKRHTKIVLVEFLIQILSVKIVSYNQRRFLVLFNCHGLWEPLYLDETPLSKQNINSKYSLQSILILLTLLKTIANAINLKLNELFCIN